MSPTVIFFSDARKEYGKKKQKKGGIQQQAKGAGGRITRNESAARGFAVQPKGKAGKKGKGAPARDEDEE